MSDTTQSGTSTPAGQAGNAGAGTTPAPAGADKKGTAGAAAGASPSVLGDAGKAADGKTDPGQGGGAGTTSAQPAAGAKVEVKLPDGVTVDPKVLGDYQTLAGKLGLDSTKATELAGWWFEQQKAAITQHDAADKQAAEAQRESHAKALRDDKEFGGAAYAASIDAAKRGLRASPFGAELHQELVNRGLDNLPAYIKTLAFFGKQITEDNSALKGAPPAAQGASEEARLRREYPEMFPDSAG